MNKLLTLCLIFMMTLIYGQKTTNEQIKIPFTETAQGHILLSTKINGVEGKFIFDTGAGVNLLTKKFADKISDLEKTDHFYTGHRATGEALAVDLWNSKTLEVGDFKLKNEIFAVYDIDFPFDGLLSLTPFKNTPITIDYEQKILIIESKKSLDQLLSAKDFILPIQVNTVGDFSVDISTAIKLNDKLHLNVGIDTGSGSNVFMFSYRYMDKLGIDIKTVPNKFRPSAFDPAKGNYFYFSKLMKISDEKDNVSFKDFKASFVDGFIHEGIMSINWIGNKITIDLPNKRLIVQK